MAILAIALLSAGALIVIAWSATRLKSDYLPVPESANHLCAVTLVNGQVYYGIVHAERGALVVDDIYYVQSVAQPGGQTDNRLVSRFKNDWHGPEHMVVPIEKVLFLESVGADSRLAKLIAVDKTATAAKQ